MSNYRRISWKTACKLPQKHIEYNVHRKWKIVGSWIKISEYPHFQLERDFGNGSEFYFRIEKKYLTKLNRLFYS